jgi:fluoride ion exporter CrcB/FEX
MTAMTHYLAIFIGGFLGTLLAIWIKWAAAKAFRHFTKGG